MPIDGKMFDILNNLYLLIMQEVKYQSFEDALQIASNNG